jgi:hypothetical protein
VILIFYKVNKFIEIFLESLKREVSYHVYDLSPEIFELKN